VLAFDAQNKPVFSPISYWMHAVPNDLVEFVNLELSTGQQLSVTQKHLIYRTPCDSPIPRVTVFAEKLQVGDCVLVQQSDNAELRPAKVVSVSHDMKIGYYSPITKEGTIIVNQVAASCYSYYEMHTGWMILSRYYEYVSYWMDTLLPTALARAFLSAPSEGSSDMEIPESLFIFDKFITTFHVQDSK